MVMKTRAQVDPTEIYLKSNEYRTLKRAYKQKASDKSFLIDDNDTVNTLIMCNLIKRQTYRPVNPESIWDERDTSRYLLTVEGDVYLDYMKGQFKREVMHNIHEWINTIVAISAVILSLIAIILGIN